MKDFDEIYRLYFREVYLYSYALTRDTHLAEDITAEAQNYSNFPGVKELRFDETVVTVYYLPITSEQQREFYHNYITPFKNGDNISALLTYEVPEVGQKVLLWGKE